MIPVKLIKYPTADAFIQARTQWLLNAINDLEKAGTITEDFAQGQLNYHEFLVSKISDFGRCFYSEVNSATIHGWWDASISDRDLFTHLANALWEIIPCSIHPSYHASHSTFIEQAGLLFDLWMQAHKVN